ncbi:MAG: flagellar hook capping protein [Planctomycetes bacterium]|nr:flagellar hook capping protein [Planctomycetota bacterium]
MARRAALESRRACSRAPHGKCARSCAGSGASTPTPERNEEEPMTISGISSSDPVSFSAGSDSTSKLDKDSFMKLLVSQMENQDPMQPADNTQMIAQLAQFSSLEQMQSLNDNIVGLAVLQQQNALLNQLTSSSGLIGKTVKYIDPSTETEQWGNVESVKIVDGLASLSIDGKDVPLANVAEIGTPPTTEGDTTSDTGSDSEDDDANA